MTNEEIEQLARDWIAYWYSRWQDKDQEPGGGYSDRSRDLYGASETLNDLLWEESPEEGWRAILAIHRLDQSGRVQEVLSAGPIEDLLAKYGGDFIGRVEQQAREDPTFAKLLGGVWKNAMTDEVWTRLQAVWDRRGWDGIPED
jgi:hypothetical protein